MALSNLPVHRISKHTRSIVFFVVLLFLSYTAALAEGPATVADLLARVNRERTTRGLPTFVLNAQLTAAAQAHASDMARTGKYSHTGSDGSTTEKRVARAGYGKAERIGENWAAYRTVDDAMKFWMQSAPHKANILHPLYREIGVGIASAPTGALVLVLDFGTRADAPAGAPASNAGASTLVTPAAKQSTPTKTSTMPALASRSERAAVAATPKTSGGLPSAPARAIGGLPAAPQQSGDAAPARISTRASSPTPTRTRQPAATRTPRPATPVPSPTPVAVAMLAVPPATESDAGRAADDEPVQLDDEAVAEGAGLVGPQPPVRDMAQVLTASVQPAIASAAPAQAVKTRMDMLAASAFGLALLMGIWAVFKYMRP